jgi:hypothetical protein
VPEPQALARAARSLDVPLQEWFALESDRLDDELEARGLVAWDRQLVLGQVQRRLRALADARSPASAPAGTRVRVIERAQQPLEAVPAAWAHLRAGRAVQLAHEPAAARGPMELLVRAGEALVRALRADGDGGEPLVVEPQPGAAAPDDDVPLAHERCALVEADADRELSAYVLARGCLRRSGGDPRAIRRAYVVGPSETLERYLVRLFVGVQLGRPHEAGAFAGPVADEAAAAFLRACAAWREASGVRELCRGARLHRGGDPGPYLAPALFAVDGPHVPNAPTRTGPLLVLHRCSAAEGAAAFSAMDGGRGRVRIGGHSFRRADPDPEVAHVRGALLVERLPAGMPEPRPA